MRTNLKIIRVLQITLLFTFVHSISQEKVQQWDVFETSFKHAYNGNPFTGVQLSATFTHKDTAYTVDGFYDGDHTFRVRFMPEKTGTWQYTTKSNVKQLNNLRGTFTCTQANGSNHGIVRVSNTYNFKYADGKQYYPVGTTAYVWNHMEKPVQELTLQSLKKSGFNKIRMCVFPKTYDLVKEEPEIYPFHSSGTEKGPDGTIRKKWNLTTFNTDFFKTLEKQIVALNQLGIEADLILFHPYDKGRWGFDALPMETNLRYIKYLVARLSSFRNIWWSMANEYDLVKSKSIDDWITLSKALKDADPYRHLLSIHGTTGTYFRYWLPEFTHVSIQDEGPVLHWGAAVLLRNAYYKPVIYDEVGYEGNLTQRWGRYSPEEMTYTMWMGAIGGTYVTHGESYMYKDASDTIFWSKGGEFKGGSWQRAGFLRKIFEESSGPWEAADASRDFHTATTGKGQYIVYFGQEINDTWIFNLPQKNGSHARLTSGKKFSVEIIDTWEMTIKPVNETFETAPVRDYRLYDQNMKKIRLPMKPYIALRITELK